VFWAGSLRWREYCFVYRYHVSKRIAVSIMCIVYRIMRCESRHTGVASRP